MRENIENEIIEKIKRNMSIDVINKINKGEINELTLKDVYEILREENYELAKRLFLEVEEGVLDYFSRYERYKFKIKGKALKIYLTGYINENENSGDYEKMDYYLIVPLENHVRVYVYETYKDIWGNVKYKKVIYHYNLDEWEKEEELEYKHFRHPF